MNFSPPQSNPIPFIDLRTQRLRIAREIDDALARVLEHGQFILGPEVRELENALGEFCGAKHVISCANGTDALGLVLMAKEVGPGDAIFCPTFTFAATAEVVAWLGATPVFVDVDPVTFNMDPKSLEQGMATAKRLGLNGVGVITVDLFGQPCEYDTIGPLCEAHQLWVLDDAAQAFGASYRGRKLGTFGAATATSFFPAKPLGCYGDGGAVFTDDANLATVMRSLRVHGEGTDKYDNVRIGINGRLDTLQAAVLIEKLKIFPDEIERRNAIAAHYSEGLSSVSAVPHVSPDCVSTWAQYTIKVAAEQRDRLAAKLKAEGIPTAVYYARPLHQQTAYRHFPTAGNGLPAAETLAAQVISLPMHPYLEPELQERIIEGVRRALQ
jgi:dTDP-4-amino-4,6-dideoxygalactose transaminase